MSKNSNNFEIKRTIHKDAIPRTKTRGKYAPIVDAAAKLDPNKALEVKIEKVTQVTSIAKNLKKHLPEKGFKVKQRQKRDGHYAYIVRQNGNK